MHRTSLPAAACAALLLTLAGTGCATHQTEADAAALSPDAQAPDAPLSAPQTASSPAALPPSLADEIKLQGTREADALGRASGIKIESLDRSPAPAWYAQAANDPARSAARSTGPTLHAAFDGAVSAAGSRVQTRGGDPHLLRVERAAWKRLPSGAFVAWAALGDGSNMGEPPPAIDLPGTEIATTTPPPEPAMPTLAKPRMAVLTGGAAATEDSASPEITKSSPPVVATHTTAQNPPPSESAPMPSLAAAKAQQAGTPREAAPAPSMATATPTTPPPPAPVQSMKVAKTAEEISPRDAGRPVWFSLSPLAANDRVAVGVICEAGSVRDCARMVLKSGKSQLEALVGKEPRNLTTQRSSTVNLPDGKVRMYAIIACDGELRTAGETKEP